MKTILAAILTLSALPALAAPRAVEPQKIIHGGSIRCGAQNLRGAIFWEVGLLPALVQARAMATCQTSSLSCHPLGCQSL